MDTTQCLYAYSIVLLISSIVFRQPYRSHRTEARQKRISIAHRIFQCALIYVLVVGGIASLFVFFFASYMVEPRGLGTASPDSGTNIFSAVSLAYSADISRPQIYGSDLRFADFGADCESPSHVLWHISLSGW